jgi:AcrR family transcriptional regulator
LEQLLESLVETLETCKNLKVSIVFMDQVKQDIIETGERLFMTYGFKRVTMDEIAGEMGISKKTIYQFFKDKNELVEEATRFSLKGEEKIIRETTQKANNSIEELFLISRQIRDKMKRMSPYILLDLKKYYKSAWNLYLDFKKEIFHNAIKDMLKRGMESGYFREDIDPEILTILRLEQVQMTFDTNVFPVDKFDFGEVQLQIFDHFVHGLLTEKGLRLLNDYLKNTNGEDK